MDVREKQEETLGEFLLWPSKLKNVWMHQAIEKLADHLIYNGVTVQEWIPVTERLPENETDVLIAYTRNGYRGYSYSCVCTAFHTDGHTSTEDSQYNWEIDYLDKDELSDKDRACILQDKDFQRRCDLWGSDFARADWERFLRKAG